MAKRKLFEDFESCRDNGPFVKYARDMKQTKGWKELKLSQIGLYDKFKDKFTKYKDGSDNRNNISFPKSEWIKYYSRKDAFDKDIDALIERGFIKVVQYQGNLRQPTIYGFSNQWKYYGTDKFNIADKDKRPKDTLSKEHKKAIGEKAKEINAKRYNKKIKIVKKNIWLMTNHTMS